MSADRLFTAGAGPGAYLLLVYAALLNYLFMNLCARTTPISILMINATATFA